MPTPLMRQYLFDHLLLNRVHQIDALELCALLPDQSVDMILADLPYGVTQVQWDTVIPFAPMWDAFKRIIKPRGAIVLTASQPFTSALVMSNPAMFRYGLVWNKKYAGNFVLAEHRPMITHEDVCIFGVESPRYYPQMIKRDIAIKGGGMSKTDVIGNNAFLALHKTYDEKYPVSMLDYPRELGRTVHPTQKPVALFEYLIKTYTREGDLVFDPVVGSGTTAVAARNCKRRYVCGDQSAEYVAIARDRLRMPFEARHVVRDNRVDDLPLFAGIEAR